jgi:hypothetical protein
LAGLGAAFVLRAGVAGIKRRRSTGGSPSRGLAMALAISGGECEHATYRMHQY